jgi:MFS family permease
MLEGEAVAATGAEPPFPIRKMFGVLAFGFAFGCMMSNFGLIMLPAEASYMQPQSNAFMLGFLLFISGISQFSGPVAGYFSDRCQNRWGRRRPYLTYAGFFSVPSLLMMAVGHHMATDGCRWPSNGGDKCIRAGVATIDGGAGCNHAGAMPDADSFSGSGLSDTGDAGGADASFGSQFVYVFFFLVAMLAFNVQMQVLGCLMNDLVPEGQIGQANGIMAVLMLTGALLGFLLYQLISGGFGSHEFLGISMPVEDPVGKMYYYYAPVILVTTIVTLTSAKEKPNPQKNDTPPSWAELKHCFWISPTLHRDFFLVTASRTMYYCGISTMAFLQYFFRDMVRKHGDGATCDVAGSSCSGNCTDGQCAVDGGVDGGSCTCAVEDFMTKTALIAVFAQGGSAVSAYPAGLLSDRVGRKPLVYASCLGMGLIYAVMPFLTGLKVVMFFGFVWYALHSFMMISLPQRASWPLASDSPPPGGGVV